MIFENDVLQHIATEEGHMRPDGSSGVICNYFLKDYLCNIRMMLQENSTPLEEMYHYVFGLSKSGISYKNPTTGLQNRYRFLDKKKQRYKSADGSRLDMYDFWTGFYDPLTVYMLGWIFINTGLIIHCDSLTRLGCSTGGTALRIGKKAACRVLRKRSGRNEHKIELRNAGRIRSQH